jgi:transcriptional regulator with XRE-family HTH domain
VFEIGISLREARERRGLEIARVAAETRIRASYLSALENERFDNLPGRVYARAFLREYAEHLGLDGQRFLDAYDARFPDLEQPPIVPAKLPQPVRLRSYAVAAAGLAALLLLGLLAWHSGGDRTTGMPTLPPPPPRPTTTEAVPAPAPPKPKPPPQARLVLTASGRCWLEVHLGSREGRTVYYRTLEAGERARFVAPRLWIRLGAPSHLTATLNGQPVSLPGTTTNVLVTPRGVEVAQGRPAR